MTTRWRGPLAVVTVLAGWLTLVSLEWLGLRASIYLDRTAPRGSAGPGSGRATPVRSGPSLIYSGGSGRADDPLDGPIRPGRRDAADDVPAGRVDRANAARPRLQSVQPSAIGAEREAGDVPAA